MLHMHMNIVVHVCTCQYWHFPFLNLSATIFRHKSACTAFPVLSMTMYSLTAYLFTKSHIAECIKSFIRLSIIEINTNKNPHGHSNTVAPLVNSIIGPCNTVVHVVKVPGFSSTVRRGSRGGGGERFSCPPLLFMLLSTASLAHPIILLLLLTAFLVPPILLLLLLSASLPPPPQPCCSHC